MPIEVLGTDHLELTVNDFARSTAFYDKVLAEFGFRRHESDHPIWGNGHLYVGLYEASEEKGATHTRRRVGFHHLALRAKARADVDRFYEFLVREGITVLYPPAEYPRYGPDYYAVFFADPDGMKLELVHFPWGYWRKVMTEGKDERPRYVGR